MLVHCYDFFNTQFYQICKQVPAYEGKFGEKDWNSLDTSYRIIADHSRTITACLADGMIPEQKYCNCAVVIGLKNMQQVFFQP